MKRLLHMLLPRVRVPKKAVKRNRAPVHQPMILSFDGRVVRLKLPE